MLALERNKRGSGRSLKSALSNGGKHVQMPQRSHVRYTRAEGKRGEKNRQKRTGSWGAPGFFFVNCLPLRRIGMQGAGHLRKKEA